MRFPALISNRLPSCVPTSFHLLVVVALAALTLPLGGCKSEPAMPPNPTTIINNVRDQLTPFRFNFATTPTVPNYHNPVLLKVHVTDAANQPAEGVTLKADVSMTGMESGAKHLTLSSKGSGDYEGPVDLDMAGSWDVALTATKDGKSGQQKLSFEVGG